MDIEHAVISLCEKHLGDFRIRNGEVVAKLCPFCKGGDNKDEGTFAVGLYNGAFSCLRGNCKKTGSFRELAEFFGERAEAAVRAPVVKRQRVYEKPDEEILHPINDKILKYFATRKISEDTLNAFHISADDKGNIVFPFYRDGVLTYVKYRRPMKETDKKAPKEWAMSNTEPILFGMDLCSFHKPLFITEGEIDALSLYEAGVTNVVSVPAGCNNLEFITLCWDWLEKFHQIVLFGDSDEPGTEMINTLMKRLGEDRCLIAPEYPELVVDGKHYGRPCKDANEILYLYGPEALAEVASHCEPAPVKGILNLADVTYVDPATMPRIYTRVPSLDNALGGLSEGGITVVSGKRGEGKSTIGGTLLLNAVDQGHSVCAYSGELPAYKFLEWITLQATERKYIGYRTDTRNGKNYACVSPEIQRRIKDWVDGRFFLFDNSYVDEMTQQEAVMKVFTICARRYGCKLFLVDNLMTVLPATDDEIKAQARFAAALKAFAVKFKAHVILVAHPRKTLPGQKFTSEDVSGSAATTNLADNVINVEKPNLRITKNRDFGVCDYIECAYDPTNRRIYQAGFGDRTIYGWDHTDLPLPEHPASELPEFAVSVAKKEQPI